MKPIHSLLAAICLVVPAAGQASDSSVSDPTVTALTALLPLRDQTKFGHFLKGNHERTRFARFLGAQGRFALLAKKEALLNIKTEADRPNYGGNSAAKVRNNLWLAYIEGRTAPNPVREQAN